MASGASIAGRRSNGPGYAHKSVLGNGWVIAQLPGLIEQDDGVIVAVNNATGSQYFDQDTEDLSNTSPAS